MKSLRQNTCCQLFVTGKGYMHVFPLEKTSDVLLALKLFSKEIGVPEALVTGSTKAKTSDEVKRFYIKIGATLKILERGTLWANLVEFHIDILKSDVSKDMTESNNLIILWYYFAERCSSIRNMIRRNIFKLQCSTPHTSLTGK